MSPFSRFPRSRLGRLSPLSRLPRTRARRIALAGVLCAALTGGAAFELGFSGGGQDPGQSPDGKPEAANARAADDAHGAPAAGTSAGTGDGAGGALSGIPERERPPHGPGVNILLVGLDTRDGMTREQKNRLHVNGEQCHCTDVMMLLHLSADRRRARIVSIPRDSFVRFARHHDTGKGVGKDPRRPRHFGKINSAYAHGGPSLTVRTVEQATGVRIDHYAETDFLGFAHTIDKIGGARVCTDKALRDENSGLKLAPGTHRVSGRTALRYARARHIDPPGDLARVRRQQAMVEGLLTRLASDRVAGDPAALARTAAALHSTVRTDDGFGIAELLRLGRQLRGLGPRHTEFATVPIADFDHRVPVWGSSLLWDRPRARALFADLRADRPLTGNPRTGPPAGKRPVAYAPRSLTVRVLGGGAAGRRMAERLRADGFRVLKSRPGDAGSGRPHSGPTTIAYDRHWERQAPTLATAVPGASLRPRNVQGKRHSPVFTVRPGTKADRVVPVVHDRSSVTGAPLTGDKLDCARKQRPVAGR